MTQRIFHRMYVRVLSWLGLAIDISSKDSGPEAILSNFTENHFVFDDIPCGGMEGFLQSLKHEDKEKQLRVCSLHGVKAKRKGTHKWKLNQIIFWKGRKIERNGEEFLQLVRQAYHAMFEQCPLFRNALAETGNKRLFHSMGKTNPCQTILTEKEFCNILTELKKEL